jgi:hypothetical protein
MLPFLLIGEKVSGPVNAHHMKGDIMSYLATARGAVCFAALVAANTAMADLSATQVWTDWKTQLTMSGTADITTSAEQQSGDTLNVRGLTLRFADEDVVLVADIGDLQFVEQRDGSVTITMPETYPITITGADGVIITVDISQSGMQMQVSGDPDVMTYDISADRYMIALRDVVDGSDTFTGDLRFMANDLTGTYQATNADLRNLQYNLAAGSFDILVDIQIPDSSGEYVTMGAKLAGLAMQADVTLPDEAQLKGSDDAFGAGLSMAGGYTIDRGEFVFDINAEGDQAAGSGSTGSSSLTLQASQQSVAYASQTRDLALQMLASGLPVPVDLSVAQYGVTFEVPMARSATAEPFRIGFDLVDLTLSDAIWDIFDPAAVLPRSPASVQIGLAGLARPLFDFFDPAQQQAINQSQTPFELAELNLTQLNIALAGANVTGSGGFSFDNSDMASFAPLPRPEGSVSITINGLNGLLDKIAAMGLIPADQLMAPRMMLGMFARATGDDQLESKLEVTKSGQVLANGQRIR